ncbi:MAG: energy transducer TonB [Xanthomonadales bacterium]|jgi:hypothetical protein|nr:energy transducer TonB [Xanthomonadales bacterium]
MKLTGNAIRNRFSGPRALRLGLMVPALAAPAFLLAQTLFGSALLTEYEAPDDAYWKIEDNTMKYPQELAQEQITGCLVARVDVSKSGKTKLRGIEKSFPASGLERPFKRYINRIRWVPVDDDQSGVKESRLIRIDFCMSYESTMAARSQCVQSVQTACE